MAQLDDTLVQGDLRVTGTVYGNATSATTANKLSLSTQKGSATQPVYFKNDGTPDVCSKDITVFWAEYTGTVSGSTAYSDIKTAINERRCVLLRYLGQTLTLSDNGGTDGPIKFRGFIGDALYEVSITTTNSWSISSIGFSLSSIGAETVHMENIYSTTFHGSLDGTASKAGSLSNTSKVGSASTPVYFTSNGLPAPCTSIDLNATSATTATTATKLDTSKVGDTNKPVYFSAGGVPTLCSAKFVYSVDSSGYESSTRYKLCVGSISSVVGVISIV